MSLCRLKSELGWINLLVFFVLTPGRHTAYFLEKLPNGVRYPLVGGTRERHFVGINFKPRKLPENAHTPTSRVHAVLGAFDLRNKALIIILISAAQHHQKRQ